jgi:putative transcriptional regulator
MSKIDKPSEAYLSIKAGLEDAIAFAKGDTSRGTLHHVEIPEPNVAKIRIESGLSQTEFAKSIGVSVGTLRNWEQGRRRPQGPARVLLALIDKQPDIVQKSLLA